MDYASCFVAQSERPWDWDNNCTISEFTISGISKLLAYGDFLKANSIQKKYNISYIIKEELDNYEYTRKLEIKVGMTLIVCNDVLNYQPPMKVRVAEVQKCQSMTRMYQCHHIV